MRLRPGSSRNLSTIFFEEKHQRVCFNGEVADSPGPRLREPLPRPGYKLFTVINARRVGRDVKYLFLAVQMHGCCCFVIYSHCKSKHVVILWREKTAACG